jgi:hypothetical protein
MTYKNCCIKAVNPPDDEKQDCSKHVEACYWNKLGENSAFFGFILQHFAPEVLNISVIE